MKPLAIKSKPTLIHVLMVLILVSYVAVRLTNLSQAVQKPKATTDTTSYVRISREPISGKEFLAGSRPWMFPLILKLFKNNTEVVAWAQGIFSIVSWAILAIAVTYSLHVSFLRLIAFAFTLLLSLYRGVIAWDSVLLTESLSLSFMVLFLAGWFWLIQGWQWHKVILLSIVALLWMFTRDTNAWVVFMIALFLLLFIALRQINKKYLVLAGVFIALFLLSNWSAERGDRWVFPFQNILGRRILPEAGAVQFFANCGMPVSPALMQLAGGYANSQERALYEDPALDGYRLWLHQDGKRCYVKWLLFHPLESIKAPMAEFNALISMQNIQTFLFSKTFSPVLPLRLEAILYPPRQLLLIFAITWGVILLAILTRAWLQNKAWWVVIGLTILVFPHYFITWHGDVMGIYRHVLSVSIQFYLGIWLLVLFALDAVLSFQTVQEGSKNSLLVKHVEQ